MSEQQQSVNVDPEQIVANDVVHRLAELETQVAKLGEIVSRLQEQVEPREADEEIGLP